MFSTAAKSRSRPSWTAAAWRWPGLQSSAATACRLPAQSAWSPAGRRPARPAAATRPPVHAAIAAKGQQGIDRAAFKRAVQPSPALKAKLAASCPGRCGAHPAFARRPPSPARPPPSLRPRPFLGLDEGAACVGKGLGVGLDLFDHGAAQRAGLFRMSSSLPWLSRSSFSSCSILMASSRASWRRRISRMSSAWRSLRLKRAISAALGSSAADDGNHLVDVEQHQVCRPSRMWMRSAPCSAGAGCGG